MHCCNAGDVQEFKIGNGGVSSYQNVAPPPNYLCCKSYISSIHLSLSLDLCLTLSLKCNAICNYIGKARNSGQSVWDSEEAASTACRERNHTSDYFLRSWSRLPRHRNISLHILYYYYHLNLIKKSQRDSSLSPTHALAWDLTRGALW